MKTLLIAFSLLLSSINRLYAAPSGCYFAQFELLSFTNTTLVATATMYYSFGSGNRGPRLVGVSAIQSNDTLYMDVYHEARGMFPAFHSVMTDTIREENVQSSASFVTVRYNEIVGSRIDYYIPDTLFHVYDSTFNIRPTSITATSGKFLFSISPNPLTGGKLRVHVASSAVGPIALNVLSSTGQRLKQVSFSGSNVYDETVDLAQLPSGRYFIEVRNARWRDFRSFIVP